MRLDGVSDAERFDALRLAFSVLQIPQEVCDGLYSTISAILWLGNISFQVTDAHTRHIQSRKGGN